MNSSTGMTKQILNARQLAIKVAWNSVYGVLGSNYNIFASTRVSSTLTIAGKNFFKKSWRNSINNIKKIFHIN